MSIISYSSIHCIWFRQHVEYRNAREMRHYKDCGVNEAGKTQTSFQMTRMIYLTSQGQCLIYHYISTHAIHSAQEKKRTAGSQSLHSCIVAFTVTVSVLTKALSFTIHPDKAYLYVRCTHGRVPCRCARRISESYGRYAATWCVIQGDGRHLVTAEYFGRPRWPGLADSCR